MIQTLALLGQEVKALASSPIRRIGFSPFGASGSTSLYGDLPRPIALDVGGWPVGTMGSASGAPEGFNPLSNSVVAACVNVVAQALSEAPPVLQIRDKQGWKRVDDHPMIALLNAPNPYLSPSDVWALTAMNELPFGEAFWYLAMEGTTPAEIWPWPNDRCEVLGIPEEPISGYRLTGENGARVEVKNSEVIHFRHAPDPNNWRRGWSPLRSGGSQISGDNRAANYQSEILHNAGVLSLLVSVKDGTSADGLTPGQLQGFMDSLRRKLKGEGAGVIAGLDLPLDVHKIGYSPDEMALDQLITYYEARICTLLGVDPMVAGLGSGTQKKTYANFAEALNDFWERRIVPLLARHAATLTAQLFPLFKLDAEQYRLFFDTSEVAALQENQDQLHTRWRENWKAGACDLWTFQTKIGMPDVPEEFKGRFVGQGAAPEGAEAEVKAVRGWQTQPRDDLGRWTDGAGNLSAAHVATVMHAEGIHESHHAAVLDKIKKGEHRTRADVLAHIDSIHATGKAGVSHSGRSVNAAFKLPHGDVGKQSATVLNAIEKVHGISKAPIIEIVEKEHKFRNAAYVHYSTGEAGHIEMGGSDRPELTIAHEIGHFIDHAELGNGAVFMSNSPVKSVEEKALFKAIENSEAIKKMKFQAKRGKFLDLDRPGEPMQFWPEKKYTAYLTSNRETFARAYSQYVALRSGNEVLKQQVKHRAETSRFYDQWEESDFEPIASALDAIFEKRGLRNGGK